MILTIYGRLPGLNDYTLRCRQNRFAGAKMKKDAEELIRGYIMSQRIPHFDKAVELNFSWYEPNSRRDLDNIAFAKKFVIDALVETGVIKSDGWKGVTGFTDSFYIDKSNPRIEVEIREAECRN